MGRDCLPRKCRLITEVQNVEVGTGTRSAGEDWRAEGRRGPGSSARSAAPTPFRSVFAVNASRVRVVILLSHSDLLLVAREQKLFINR